MLRLAIQGGSVRNGLPGWARVLIACLLCGASPHATLAFQQLVEPTHRRTTAPATASDPLGEDAACINPPPVSVSSGVTDQPRDVEYKEAWQHQLLPDGLIYRTCLAGLLEPRVCSVLSRQDGFGPVWDNTLGTRVAIWRYGTQIDNGHVDGYELEVEGAVFPRLDPFEESTPLIASDYRVGIPLVYGDGPWHFKLAYCHLCAHLGDEWVLLHPGIRRLNYVRDEIVIGADVYLDDDWRTYGELGYAPSHSDGAQPLELQFGAEFSPVHHNDWGGAPFAAINVHLRQENSFGGYFAAQAGWQWRNGSTGHLLRLGMQYVTGKSDLGEFYDLNEQRVGVGVWYDP